MDNRPPRVVSPFLDLVSRVQSLVQLGSTVNKNASYSSYDMEIIVPADSTISDVSQVTSLLAPVDNDGDNITKLLDSLQSEKNVTLTPTPTASYMDAYQAMMAGQGDAMVLNSVFLEMLRAEDPEVDSKIKVLYSVTNEIKTNLQVQIKKRVMPSISTSAVLILTDQSHPYLGLMSISL